MVNIPFLDKFPTKVFILQRRGSGVVVTSDSARFIKKEEGRRVYELKGKKNETVPVPFKYIQTTSDGEPVIFLYEYERGHYKPIDANVTENDADFEPVDEADIAWEQYQSAMADEMHQKQVPWYVKYQQFITMALTMIFMIILAFIFMKNISQSSQNIVEAFSQGMKQAGASAPPG